MTDQRAAMIAALKAEIERQGDESSMWVSTPFADDQMTVDGEIDLGKLADAALATVGRSDIVWTPELEKARVDLCEFWAGLADDWPGASEVTRRAVETEQALTILGDIAMGGKL